MTRTLLRAAVPSLVLLLGVLACTNSSDLPGGPCGTCSEVYTNGGITCGPGPAADAWRTLSFCACGNGPCSGSCTSSFCQTLPATDLPDAGENCGDCLAMNCASQLANCSQN